MHKKISVGIDIGKNGAIVMINDEGPTKYLMPKISGEIDLNALKEHFSLLGLALSGGTKVHVVMEDLHAIFGASAAATFSFGWINGVIETFCIAYQIPYTKVQATKWQKTMFEGLTQIRKPDKPGKKGNIVKGRLDTKPMSIMAAKRLFPGFSLKINDVVEYYADNYSNRKLKRVGKVIETDSKDQDGISDALLMAEYGRRNF